MSLIAEMFKEPCRNASGESLRDLQNLARAVETGKTDALPDTQRDCAARMRQAGEKIESGAPLARMSELLTLAQFGGGALGAAIAEIYGRNDAQANLQALFVALFLTDVVQNWRESPGLLPDDCLNRQGLSRGSLDPKTALPVFKDIIARAADAEKRITGSPAGPPGELARLIALQRRLIRKRVNGIAKGGAGADNIDLGLWDRIAVAVSFRLRLRGTA